MEHTLKLWPKYFREVRAGRKTLELRREDIRRFSVGDLLILLEYDPDQITQAPSPDAPRAPLHPDPALADDSGGYTGAVCRVQVLDVLRDPEGRWLQPNIAALSIRLLDPPLRDDLGTAFTAMYADATHRLRIAIAPDGMEQDPVFTAWPQVWGDTACGFGGFAGQALTVAPTFVWTLPGHSCSVVYHHYRWAYTLHRPNAAFVAACYQRCLPGQSETSAITALEDPPMP